MAASWKTIVLTCAVGLLCLAALTILSLTRPQAADVSITLLVFGFATAGVVGVALGSGVVLRRRTGDGSETSAEIGSRKPGPKGPTNSGLARRHTNQAHDELRDGKARKQ